MLFAVPVFAQDSPWARAALYRDAWGVPYIFADDPGAMAFAFGYAQAQDHLEPMLLSYRVAQGRAAEVLGPSYADWDAFALRVAHVQVAREAWPTLDALTRTLCEGFAEGVNSYLVEHKDGAPEWAEAVQPTDVLALWHALLTSQAPLDLAGIARPPAAFDSGLAWAVAPSRSDARAPLFALGAHMHYNGPFRWYEAFLSAGDYAVRGAALYGLPVIFQGFTANHAWALTPNQPDFADVAEIQPQGPRRNPGNPSPATLFDENALALEMMANAQTYHVRTEEGLEERFVPVMLRPEGPILEGSNGGLYVWRIGGYRYLGGLAQLFHMGRTPDINEFDALLDQRHLPCFHVVFASREFIAYRYLAHTGARQFPVLSEDDRRRAQETDYTQPQPAWLVQAAWDQVIPPDMLPASTNPPAGYVQACGNPPWRATSEKDAAAQQFPAWFGRDEDSFRAQRARQLLRAGNRSFADMQAMLYDVVAPAAAEMAPLLIKIADARPETMRGEHPDVAPALDLLRNWNYLADTESAGMTYYHLWWAALRARAGQALPSDAAAYAALRAGGVESEALALGAAGEAARMLRNEYDRVAVPWGEVHRVQRGEQDYPLPGAATGEPIFTASDHVFRDGKWWATYGLGYALAVQLGPQPEAVSVSIFGSSDVADSPHFADQLPLVQQRRFKRCLFDRAAIVREAAGAYGQRLELRPRTQPASVLFVAAEPIAARLETTEPPEALPPGLAAFTEFLAPKWEPSGAPVQLDVRLRVSPGLCATDSLAQLSLYAHEAGLGWRFVEGQQLDTANRTFRAPAQSAALFAVLGPSALLLAPTEPGAKTPPAPVVAEALPALPEMPVPPPGALPAAPGGLQRASSPLEHALGPPPAAAEPPSGRIFNFKIGGTPEEETAEAAGAEAKKAGPPRGMVDRSQGGKKFRIQLHDVPAEEPNGAAKPAPDSAPVPAPAPAGETGANQSPPPAPASPDTPKSGTRKFKLERLD